MSYQPPPASVGRLGGIVDLLSRATKIEHHFDKGGKAIFTLPDGQLYYDSLLDLDSDGSRFATQDATGQSDTTLHQPDGKPVDADAVPFFVLPGGGFAGEFGIHLGDVAAVIYKDKVEFAVFADRGPRKKLGEGSIALHRSLGHETIRHSKFHDEAIDHDVITIVFPGSGDGTPQTPDRIREIGGRLFTDLGARSLKRWVPSPLCRRIRYPASHLPHAGDKTCPLVRRLLKESVKHLCESYFLGGDR